MGILNIGNTCYLASALQCIVSTDSIDRYIRDTEQSNGVIDVYRDLHRRVRQDVGLVDPTRMYNIIKTQCSTFVDNEQNDAHEALIIILDILSRSFKKEFTAMHTHRAWWERESYDIIDHVFTMVTENAVFCESCKHEIINYESSYGMYCPMRTNVKDELPGYVCDRCKSTDTSYRISRVVRYPKTLIVLNPSVKTETFIFGKHTYETFAICNYKKVDRETGHYNVIVRDSDKWILKDDCVYRPVTGRFEDLMKHASFILTRRMGRRHVHGR